MVDWTELPVGDWLFIGAVVGIPSALWWAYNRGREEGSDTERQSQQERAAMFESLAEAEAEAKSRAKGRPKVELPWIDAPTIVDMDLEELERRSPAPLPHDSPGVYRSEWYRDLQDRARNQGGVGMSKLPTCEYRDPDWGNVCGKEVKMPPSDATGRQGPYLCQEHIKAYNDRQDKP